MSNVKPVPGTNGNQYIPYDQRTGKSLWYISPGTCLLPV